MQSVVWILALAGAARAVSTPSEAVPRRGDMDPVQENAWIDSQADALVNPVVKPAGVSHVPIKVVEEPPRPVKPVVKPAAEAHVPVKSAAESHATKNTNMPTPPPTMQHVNEPSGKKNGLAYPNTTSHDGAKPSNGPVPIDTLNKMKNTEHTLATSHAPDAHHKNKTIVLQDDIHIETTLYIKSVVAVCVANPNCAWHEHALKVSCALDLNCLQRVQTCQVICAGNDICVKAVERGHLPEQACLGHVECVTAVASSTRTKSIPAPPSSGASSGSEAKQQAVCVDGKCPPQEKVCVDGKCPPQEKPRLECNPVNPPSKSPNSTTSRSGSGSPPASKVPGHDSPSPSHAQGKAVPSAHRATPSAGSPPSRQTPSTNKVPSASKATPPAGSPPSPQTPSINKVPSASRATPSASAASPPRQNPSTSKTPEKISSAAKGPCNALAGLFALCAFLIL